FILNLRHPRCTLFPYTTLFRSIELLSKLMINQELWSQLNELQQQTIRTIHLKQNQLMNLKQGELKSGYRYLAACHDLSALMHARSEEHTSELQSRENLVCRLLL